jgi:DNA-binding CsgD family transcriptional regulator
MVRREPGSQSRALLAEKQRIAEQLLARGLTVTQICKQLRCSPAFVRNVRDRTKGAA